MTLSKGENNARFGKILHLISYFLFLTVAKAIVNRTPSISKFNVS